MADNLPYLVSPGMLNTGLEKIKAAATPERFTQDFLAQTLGMKGGSPRPLIPFLKRISFLGTDGVPTDLYKAFRNSAKSGAAAASALRHGYKPLFDMNERAHELGDAELKGLVVQATGLEESSRAVQFILATFKALKKHASFTAGAVLQLKKAESAGSKESKSKIEERQDDDDNDVGIHLSYTINLNLPPTPDIAVFNAIFRLCGRTCSNHEEGYLPGGRDTTLRNVESTARSRTGSDRD